MEKIQPLINFLKKNKFWLSCGAMAMVLIGVWLMTSMNLVAQQDKNTKDLKARIAELSKVLNTGAEIGSETNNLKAHPNDTTKTGMDLRISDAADSMIKAWKLRRAAQEPIMQWPAEALTDPKFVKFFSRFDPPEAFKNVSSSEYSGFLQVYSEKIQGRMPELCKIIGTNWNNQAEYEKAKAIGSASAPPKAGGGPTAAVSSDGRKEKVVVEWDKKNQALWLQKLTSFSGNDGNKMVYATAHQAFALQQDLWLLEAVFKVIKSVNGDADANDLAAIRVIDHIVFGREARTKLGKTVLPDTSKFADASAKTGSMANEGVQAPSESLVKGNDGFAIAPPMSGQDSGRTEFTKDPPPDLLLMGPFHGRYVDVNYEPLGIQDVYDVLRADAKGLPERNLELMVAKRVPVRIALKMNETKIPNFVAACSNSPFGFEIYQIRVNVHKPGENIELNGGAKKSTGSGDSKDRDAPTAAMGGGQGGSGVDGGGEESAGGAGSGGGENAVGPFKAERRTNHIVDVEFYGVVKIYNPVNESRLVPVDEDAPVTPGPTANTSGAAATTKSGKP